MRILVVTVDAPPRLGGVATMAHHLADSFAAGAEWAGLLGPRGAHPPAPSRYACIEDFESSADLDNEPSAAREDRRIAALIDAAIERYAIDAVLLGHAHYYGPGALDAARRRGVAIATVVHGLEVSSRLMTRAESRDAEARARRLRPLVDDVDAVFANSRATARMLREIGARAPIHVCGVGLSPEDFARETALSPTVDPLQRRARRRALDSAVGAAQGPLLVSVGRLAPHKRVDRLLDLAARLAEAQVVIVGEGLARPALEARAAALGVRDRVSFLGAVDDAAKWAVLRAADFAALFSEADPATGAYEGFGIAMLEGCAAGAVTLSSGADGMADFVTEAGGGVALDLRRDPEGAAARVRALADDAPARAAIVARGRAAIAARWLWPAVAARVRAVWPQDPARAVAGRAS